MSQLNEMRKHLRPGQVYRRSDLERLSSAVDRHLKQLQNEGTLNKLSGGLYYYPKKTVYGNAPADDAKLVESFLKDDKFLLTSPNAYNALGVGTTQLYNQTVVYNHKRHGQFKLGSRVFEFRRKPRFPSKNSEEFLLVDLVNNLKELAEDEKQVLNRVKEKSLSMDQNKLSKAVRNYGAERTKKFFAEVLENGTKQNHRSFAA